MDLLQLLGLDPKVLMKEYEGVMSTLEGCGLSPYQARAYLALVAQSEACAKDVADVARVPRTSAYKALRALVKEGWARSMGGRPEFFVPTPPEEMYQRLTTPVRETFEKISLAQGMLSARGTPQMVYTIYGKGRVLRKIAELVERSTEHLILSTPRFSALRSTLSKALRNAARRGVRVVVLTAPYQRVPEDLEAHRREGLIATDLISDGRTALIASQDLEACGYTDNPELARHLQDFLRILVESTGDSERS
ncbi:MAG: helix-turn-helix domain-containing protein [Candidatus Thermoplasmatota archaeon]